MSDPNCCVTLKILPVIWEICESLILPPPPAAVDDVSNRFVLPIY